MPANTSSQDLLSYLRVNGPTPSSDLVTNFGISRATLSRRARKLGPKIITIGKGRATQLAARHEDASTATPLYRVLESGQVQPIGQLIPIHEGTNTQWVLSVEDGPIALIEGEFKNGLFPNLPWFLEDLRPAGFLGRAFGKRMANLLQIDQTPEKWSDLELLSTLVNFGSNLQGNFIIGDGRALSEFQEHKVQTAEGYYKNSAPHVYPAYAQDALDESEEYGSSAGGEQPKFTTMVCDQPESSPRAVIVKFSPKRTSQSGQRWGDLLHAEHLANKVLATAGFDTAKTRIFEFDERTFLESERFDRIGNSGRRGIVSLRSFDAAHIGGKGTWADSARKLHADKWITNDDCERIVQLHCFGELIANTDMHWGNLSFFLPEKSPYPLAPVYDMLPMRFRPSSTGEVNTREFKPTLPKPEDQAAWLTMYPHAIAYWQQVQESADISTDFQKIAEQAINALQNIYKIAIS